jgi:hypothetical protein
LLALALGVGATAFLLDRYVDPGYDWRWVVMLGFFPAAVVLVVTVH